MRKSPQADLFSIIFDTTEKKLPRSADVCFDGLTNQNKHQLNAENFLSYYRCYYYYQPLADYYIMLKIELLCFVQF